MSGSGNGRLSFDDILCAEIEAINQRREALGRAKLDSDACIGASGKVLDGVGLALSGGGVRSAAFSLGVLQALDHHDALRNVDYLSTVSGGGYIGCALTATMTCTEGKFVFGNTSAGGGEQAASEVADTPSVGHLRNYSNYLVPRGLWDIVTGLAIVTRGLVANTAFVLAALLLFAAVTIALTPTRSSLGCPDMPGFDICDLLIVDSFGYTLLATLIGLLVFFLWAIFRSLVRPGPEFRMLLPTYGGIYLVIVAMFFFLDLQTFFLRGMFDLAEKGKPADEATFEWLTGGMQTLAAIAAPVAALVTFFRQQMGDILKAANAGSNLVTKVIAALSRVAFWVAGAAVPLVIWVVYLYLSFWGMINDGRNSVEDDASNDPPISQTSCAYSKPGGDLELGEGGRHTPRWLIVKATWITYVVVCPGFRNVALAVEDNRWLNWIGWLYLRTLDRPMVVLYGLAGIALIFLALLLKPNANSLHRLYRDRLSKAFLFDPRHRESTAPVRREHASHDQGRDFAQLDEMPLSALSVRHAPYHIINAALNIQGSDYANRRGRDADFFLFSPLHLGSEATGYATMGDFEKEARDLDIATALAISGAAASSNMGSASIRPLRPTLALLNIRLGYWLKNPRYVSGQSAIPRRPIANLSCFFLMREIFGRLYENSNFVYLTDGGHVENLGIYQLLKRRCRFIVVVDAEADIAMRFPSFMTLQRYARIDLGVRIDMPWDDIRKTTRKHMHVNAGGEGDSAPAPGPHAAIGSIDYGAGRSGYILYVKTSLTGDENDYISDYARRSQIFPHESTGDQFFTEEQFEVYRALGFHIVHGALCGRDDICVPGPQGKKCKFNEPGCEAAEAVRTALLDDRIATSGFWRASA
jgi:hypothetical protein